MIWHVLPINDLDKHLEESTCKCLPKSEVLENGDMIIIHNSFDKREIIERLFEDLRGNENSKSDFKVTYTKKNAHNGMKNIN